VLAVGQNPQPSPHRDNVSLAYLKHRVKKQKLPLQREVFALTSPED